MNVACSRLRDSGEKAFSKKKCEKRAGAGERASYFRFARFNTSALYYLRAWHRLVRMRSYEHNNFFAHLHMYLFSTIFCTFFFTSFLFFDGTFSSPYIKGKTKQNSCIINIYNCTRQRRVGGVGEVGINSAFLGLSKDPIQCVDILIISFGLQWNLYSGDTFWTKASVP